MALTLNSARTAPRGNAVVTLRSYTLSSPVAGNDFSVTVLDGETWRFVGLRAALTTSVTVANRLPALLLRPGGTPAYQTPSPGAVPASSSGVFGATIGAAFAIDAAFCATVPLPDVLLIAGSILGAATTNLQAGDQWSSVTFAVYVYV